MKVGVLGAGGIAREHVPSWVALGAEVRIHSMSGAERLALESGVGVESDPDALIAWADVIDICTPTTTHAPLALAAIAAGTDVLCEKPLGRTVDEARSVADAARTAGVRVYPAHVVRYFPEYVALHTAVMDGRIGIPAILRFSRGGAGPASDWFYAAALSGGVVMDQLIHDMDQARWIAGAVTQVYAVQNPPNEHGSVPHSVTAHVTLTHASGALSFIQGVWGPAGMKFRTSFDVAGSEGVLRFSSTDAGATDDNLAAAPTDGGYLPATTAEESPYLVQLREFAAAFRGGPEPRVSLDDGVVAVALANAAEESIATARAVIFDERAILAGEAHR